MCRIVCRTWVWSVGERLAQISCGRSIGGGGGSEGVGGSSTQGSGSWQTLGLAVGQGFRFLIGNLLIYLYEGGYHSEQGMHARDRQATGRGADRKIAQAGRRDRDDALDPRIEPDHTDAAQPWFGGDANERQAETI